MSVKSTRVDFGFAIAVTALLLVGMVMVFSASSMVAVDKYHSLTYFFRKQMMWGALAFALMLIVSRFDYRRLDHKYIASIGVLLSILLLFGLFVLGVKVNGARRWYNLGIMNFQPSELAKLTLIIYVAHYLSSPRRNLRDLRKGVLPLMTVILLVLLPVLLQPDLSTTLMMALIIGSMLFVSRIRIAHIAATMLPLIPFALFLMRRQTYQQGRISGWMRALHDPLSAPYQIKQSLIGLGRGGLIGQGLAQSKQKFIFLPDSHTDFIFSILGEEWGWIGTTIILSLFVFLLYRGLKIAHRAPDGFGKYLALGITFNIIYYAFVNAAVVSMLLPATGLPMPFISYGGSHLVFLGFSVGLLLNISRTRTAAGLKANWEDFKQKRERLYRTVLSID